MRIRLAIAAGGLLALVAAYLAGRYAAPVEVRERTVLDERLVSQAVENARAEWQRNVKTHTVTRIVYRDGRPAERVTTTDRDVTSSGASSSQATTQTQATTTTTAEKATKSDRPGWRAGASAQWADLTSRPQAIGLELDRRLFGTVWAGVRVGTDRRAGVAVGLEW